MGYSGNGETDIETKGLCKNAENNAADCDNSSIRTRKHPTREYTECGKKVDP